MAEEQPGGFRSLLTDLGIERVVCVDDLYVADPDTDGLIAWLASPSNRPAAKGITQHLAMRVDLDAETASSEVRTMLTADADLARRLRTAVDQASPSRSLPDAGGNSAQYASVALTLLDDLLDGFGDFRRLGPAEWQSQESGLLDEATRHPTLFIFDEELGDGFATGTSLIGKLASSPGAACSYFVLLSYWVTEDNEQVKTTSLQGLGIAAAAVPKKELRGPASAEFITLRLRAAILWSRSGPLRAACDSAMEAAVLTAHEKVHGLTPLEFDEVFFRSSSSEGVHEVDTLIRVYSNAFASRFREELRGHSGATGAIAKLRHYRAREASATKGSSAWRLYREELYDSGSYINGCGVPLSSGDVFRMTDTAGTDLGEFALLAQPCDLIVRLNGQRKVGSALLAPIRPGACTAGETGLFALNCFCSDTGADSVVNMRDATALDLRLLDLCFLNADGMARITSPSSPPEHLTSGWKIRLQDVLHPFASQVADALSNYREPAARTSVAPMELPTCWVPFGGTHLLGVTVERAQERSTITFSVKRTTRLSKGQAAALMQAYAAHLSRPARPYSLSEAGKPSR